MSFQSELKTQDALDALTSGLQAGDDVDDLLAQSGTTAAEAEGLVEIIQALYDAVAPVEPSREFNDALRDELLGGNHGMVQRVRQMPARVHVAAFLAVIAGCLLFIVRRIFDSDAPQEIQEEAVATPL